MRQERGILSVVSGFSGSGKGTVMKRLLEKYPENYALSISATTRNPRPGEVDGREYFFKTKEQFEKMIAEQELIEYANYVGNYYGTPRAYVEEQLSLGKNVILEIEIQGASVSYTHLPDATLSDIERVYSHPQALMQSARYLDEHRDWQQISVANTAVAARKVLEDDDVKKAAICSEHAAEVYGLKVLDREINDNPANSTRFIIVTNQKIFRKNASKISICFEVSHESGSLYHMLSHFIYNDLNMTKIESRPIEGRPWEYRFFVDFDGNMADPAVKNAIRGLREESRNLKILGNY